MHCILIGYCWLVLVNFSVCLSVIQKPRFLGVKSGRTVSISCVNSDHSQPAEVQWFKGLKYHQTKEPLVNGYNLKIRMKDFIASIKLLKVQPKDSGVYFCQLNATLGPGTELQVLRNIKPEDAIRRSRIKDAMIIFQALLLVICALVPLLFHLTKVEREDTIYEEPEDDHLYEGLEVENRGLYEEIPALSLSCEASWAGPESP